MKRTLTIVAIVMCLISLALPNVSAEKPFDLCIQDDSGTPVLRLASLTGQYAFDDCDGTVLAGFGKVSKYSGAIGFGFTNGDFKAQFSIDTAGKSASGFVRDRVTGQNAYTLTDTNYQKGNTCACP